MESPGLAACGSVEARAARARALLAGDAAEDALAEALLARLEASEGGTGSSEGEFVTQLESLLAEPRLAQAAADWPDSVTQAFNPRRHAFLAARQPPEPTQVAAPVEASLPLCGCPEGEDWPGPRHAPWLCGGECPALGCSGSRRLPEGAAAQVLGGRPLVLRGLGLLPGAVERWSFDYLAEHIRGDHNVFASHDGAFTYWYGKANSSGFDFAAPTQREALTFREFLARHRKEAVGSEDRSSLYFQDTIWNVRDGRGNAGPLKREMLSDALLQDWEGLAWEVLEEVQRAGSLSSLSTSTLFCSGRGAYSRPHYDQMANLHLQIRGAKRWLLFPPEDAPMLYAYPRGHPLDRKSRLDFASPDLAAFPGAAGLEGRGLCAVLLPGDALWLPSHWWHSVHSLEDETVSLNFWWDPPGPEAMANGPAYIELARDIEDLILRVLGPGPHVEGFLRALQEGAPTLSGDAAKLRCFLLRQLVEIRCAGRLPGHAALEVLRMLDARRYAGLSFVSQEELSARAEAEAEAAFVREMRRQGATNYVLHEGRAVDLEDPEDTEGLGEGLLAALHARAASDGGVEAAPPRKQPGAAAAA